MRDAFFCLLRPFRVRWGCAAAISRGRLRVRLCGRFRRGDGWRNLGGRRWIGRIRGRGVAPCGVRMDRVWSLLHGRGGLAARVKPFGRAGAGWCMLCFGRFSRVEERRIPADWKRCRPVRLRRGLRTAPVRDKKNGGPMMFGPPFLLSTFSVAPLRQLMLRRSGSWLGEAASMSIWSFTIWMAAAAASSPLLPRRPPQRSSACCMSLTVSTPKAMGMFH